MRVEQSGHEEPCGSKAGIETDRELDASACSARRSGIPSHFHRVHDACAAALGGGDFGPVDAGERGVGLAPAFVSMKKGLLPQPGGFEGFLVIPEVFDQDDLALSECHDLTDSHFRLDPRLLACRVRSYSQNHSPTTCVD